METSRGEPVRASFFLDKGGVGKTTAAAHFGVALHEQGYDVLLIDLAGKQGDLAKHFGIWPEVQDEEDDWPNIATVFQDQWSAIAEKVPDAVEGLIWDTGEGPDIIPAHRDLDGLDDLLGNIDDAGDRYSRLDAFLNGYVDGYDVILVDLPGSTSNVSYNGIWAAQNVVAPVLPGSFEEDQAAELRRDLERIEDNQGITIDLAMLMINGIDAQTKAGRHFQDEFSAEYSDAIAPAQVCSSQDIRNAQLDGKTLFALEDPSSTAERASKAYRENAAALIEQLS